MAEVEKKQEVAKSNGNKITDFSLGIFGTSDNFIMAGQMAKALSESTIVPKEYQGNTANSMVAIEIANRLQTSPLMVMQNLNVIQGRPSWSAQFLIAMVNGSGKYDMELQFDEKQDADGKPYACQCWTMKNGRKVTGITVDMDMAKAEGWVAKNGSKWKTMPQLMLQYRAATFLIRTVAPELAMGLRTEDEILDTIEVTPVVEQDSMEVAKEIEKINATSQVVDIPTPAAKVEEKQETAAKTQQPKAAQPAWMK